ncbi:MAG: hypothetical protein NWR72_00965, partial [Bacteroidia bacterium]|nr:hypothetical protein [Bacteroidia bacterium]
MKQHLLTIFFGFIFLSPMLASSPDSTEVSRPFSIKKISDALVIESTDSGLEISMYSLKGEKIPFTLWKSKVGDHTKFEAGYDLQDGVY